MFLMEPSGTFRKSGYLLLGSFFFLGSYYLGCYIIGSPLSLTHGLEVPLFFGNPQVSRRERTRDNEHLLPAPAAAPGEEFRADLDPKTCLF